MSTETPAAGADAGPAKAASPWPPVIAMVVLMPAISWAVTNFVLLPKIREAALAPSAEGEHAGADSGAHSEKSGEKGHAEKPKGEHGKAEKGKGEKGETGGKFTYDFENLVVNLSGSMGTRYLKTSFTVFSSNPDLKKVIDENKKQLLDVSIGVLGSRSLADLEQAGAKNVIRNDLMANFNEALKSDLIDQIYFSEFVVQ